MLRFSILAVLLVSYFWSSSAVANDRQFAITAVVTDTDGNPIADAEVQFFAVNRQHYSYYKQLLQSEGTLESRTDSDGGVTFRLERGSPSLALSQYDPCYLAVRSDGHQIHIEKLTLLRCHSDHPIEIQLELAAETNISIQSFDGQPLADAEVRVAVVGDNKLPFDEASETTRQTDASGSTVLTQFGSIPPTWIYVSHQSIGHQCLPVQSVVIDGEKVWRAKCLESKPLSGRVSHERSDLHASPDMESVELLIFSGGETEESGTGWSRVRLDEKGGFEIPALAVGNISSRAILQSDLPYHFGYQQVSADAFNSVGELRFELKVATLVLGFVEITGSRDPIPDVYIQRVDGDNRVAVTDSFGLFSFWTVDDQSNYLPVDPMGIYGTGGNGYLKIPQQTADLGQIRLPACTMIRSTRANIQVVDGKNMPVAGAKVSATFERQWGLSTLEFISDSTGTVTFYGLEPNLNVVLSGRYQQLVTREPDDATPLFDGQQLPPLQLVAVPTMRFSGMIVDSNNLPIANAIVTLRKPEIFQAASTYSGVDRRAKPIFPDTVIATNEQGRFETPSIPEFDGDIGLTITADGFRDRNTPWTPLNQLTTVSTRIELPAVGLISTPEIRNVQIVVRDQENGSPIESARVVFFGVRSELNKKVVSPGDDAAFSVPDVPQLLAVTADGYAPTIQSLKSIESGEIEVELNRHWDTQSRSSAPELEERRQLLRGFVNDLEKPQGDDFSFRTRYYYQSLLFGNPAEFVDLFPKILASGHNDSILNLSVDQLSSHQLATLTPQLDGESRFAAILQRIRQTVSSDECMRLAKEAKSPVEDRNLHRLAYALLERGLVDEARQLIEETWRAHPELSDFSNTGEPIARRDPRMKFRELLPLGSIVDRRAAMEMIGLVSRPEQLASNRSTALAVLAAFDAPSWRGSIDAFAGEGVNAMGALTFIQRAGFTSVPRGLELAERMPPTPSKVSFLALLIEHAENEAEVQRVADAALAVLRSNEQTGRRTTDAASQACRYLAQSHPDLAAHFAFEAFWNNEFSNTILPFTKHSKLAIGLAHLDTELARVLIEPCFDDYSWLFDDNDWDRNYSASMPFIAASTIDPTWAISEFEKLTADQLRHHPDRLISLANVIITRRGDIFTF